MGSKYQKYPVTMYLKRMCLTREIKVIVKVQSIPVSLWLSTHFPDICFIKKYENGICCRSKLHGAWDHAGMSGSAGQISLIQCLFVSDSGQAEPHSFPKAPLCHELSLNATLLSIDLLAMHFLPCFDVIVVSVYGRFQIKLWRGLAFKPVISGDYSSAVELTFLFFFWPQTGLCDALQQRRYQIIIAKCNYHEPPSLRRRPVLIGSGENPVPGIWVR